MTCSWGYIFSPIFHGSRGVKSQDHHVISSKEEFDCGFGVGAGAYAEVSHPLYAMTGQKKIFSYIKYLGLVQ